MCRLIPCLMGLCVFILGSPSVSEAQNPTVAPMIRLIEGGRLPESRMGTVIGLICKRGDAEDLTYLFDKTVSPEGFAPAVRLETLQQLAETTRNRNLKPTGDLTRLSHILDSATEKEAIPLQKQVIELVGLWQVKELTDDLQKRLQAGPPSALTGAIIETLAQLGGKDAAQMIQSLTTAEQPQAVRKQAIESLAGIDLKLAAQAAASYLAETTPEDSLTNLIQPFLARQQGPELLGKAVAEQKIEADVAKMALRAMLTAGRNDESLSAPLSEAAGLDSKMEPLSAEELKALVQEVQEKGDAARGELVFRREELSCYKCHSLGKAGGNVGPDLSPIGGSSPIDYLVNSLLLPSQAIKEAYKTMLVVDIDGLSHTGIVVDQDDNRIILRNAEGKEKTIAVDDIEFEKEGDSLMPAGLTKFLTHQEFVDLIRFLSALGKDPEYTMSADPTVYRWRVYNGTPGKVAGKLFDDDSVRNMLFEYAPEKWEAIYSHASGALPIQEARKIAKNQIVFAYAELDVNVAGHIKLELPSEQGVVVWLDQKRVPTEDWSQLNVSTGQHRLLFRIDTQEYPAQDLKVVIQKGASPAAEYAIVVGQ